MPRFLRLLASFVLLLLGESSCQKRQVAVPVPPPPTANSPASQDATPAATSSTTPSSGTTTPEQDPGTYQVNKPPPQSGPAAKKPARSATPVAPSPTPAALAPASVAPAPVPKLGDILTPDEQKQYSASIDQSLARAQASLNSIGARPLTNNQQGQMEQIRKFMQQAQSSRASDLAGAKSLAERAEVLARDLAATFH
jgi:hypothetical protein